MAFCSSVSGFLLLFRLFPDLGHETKHLGLHDSVALQFLAAADGDFDPVVRAALENAIGGGLDRWPNLRAFNERMRQRDSVRNVLRFEGLLQEEPAG